MGIVISVQDQTTEGTFTTEEVSAMVAAISQQATEDFNHSPWVEHGYCKPCESVVLVPRGEPLPSGTWHAELLDTSDQAGALGYHEDKAFDANSPGPKGSHRRPVVSAPTRRNCP